MTAQPPPRLPLVLLALLTLATFAGPFVAALVIAGGRHASWPPDRPVEWWTFGLVCGAVVVLMVACLVSAGRALRQASHKPRPPGEVGRESVRVRENDQ